MRRLLAAAALAAVSICGPALALTEKAEPRATPPPAPEPPPAPRAIGMACGERGTILQALKRDYREDPVALGLDAQGRMMEVLASADGKTWTILVTAPSGLACLVASGISWELLPAAFGPVL